MPARVLFLSSMLLLARAALGCDLCAIYNADTASGQSGHGFSINLAEQYIPYDTVQLNGETLPPSSLDQNYLHKSMAHIVPTWSFSPRFSVSLSLPVIYQRYRETHLLPANPFVETTSGEQTGIGDLSLIGRATLFRASKGQLAASVSVLGGVKFPTGNTYWLEQEVSLTRALDQLYGPGHQHAISGVHFTDLTFGSGSYDGIFGVTANSRWSRIFCNGQFQYYLRTPGVTGYEFGDEWMITGGPGVYMLLSEAFTLSLQCVATYDQMDSDLLLGRENPNSGMTAIYLGPLFNCTIGERFSANAGFDWPMMLDNNGLQNVPDYRVHGGISFRF
jgi:hypothetical protein